jgi:hypothetical protein
VLITGVAREVTDPDDLAAVRVLPLARWAPHGPDDRVIAISTELVDGRRILGDRVEAGSA